MPFVEHPHCTLPDDDVVLWRYMSLSKFLSLLQMESLYFAAVSSFEDRYEGQFTEDDLERAGPMTLSDVEIDGVRLYQGIRPVMEVASQLRGRAVLNCWTIHEHEQDLLWTRYDAKVAVKTTWASLRAALLSSPREVIGSKVTYSATGKFDAFVREWWADSVLFTKRAQFQSECEFRLAMIDWQRRTPWDGVSVPIDLKTLIAEVRLCPATPPWEATAIAETMRRFEVKAPLLSSSIDRNR